MYSHENCQGREKSIRYKESNLGCLAYYANALADKLFLTTVAVITHSNNLSAVLCSLPYHATQPSPSDCNFKLHKKHKIWKRPPAKVFLKNIFNIHFFMKATISSTKILITNRLFLNRTAFEPGDCKFKTIKKLKICKRPPENIFCKY